jgi:anti-sigma B factor antagonist
VRDVPVEPTAVSTERGTVGSPRGGLINALRSGAAAAPFEVTVVDGPEDGQLVARVCGELDAATNPLLQQTLLGALRQADRLLTLDLSGVTFFGSAGVTALVWLSQHPEAAGKHVRVVATSRIVTGPLELTGLLDRLDVQGMPDGARPSPGTTRAT